MGGEDWERGDRRGEMGDGYRDEINMRRGDMRRDMRERWGWERGDGI